MRTFRDSQPEDAAQTESARMKMYAQYLKKMQFKEKTKISELVLLARLEILLLLEQGDLKQKCIYQLWKKTSRGPIHTRDITQHWLLVSLYLHQLHREKATFKTRLALADTSQTHHTLSTQMHHAKEASLCQPHVRS